MSALRILVVEDNELNLELTLDLLECAGYAVSSATTAEEGIRQAHRERPNLILMDVSLPGMDGLTAASALKADQEVAEIPIVALTAHAMNGDRERAFQAGCCGYITKPLDTRTFSAQVASFVRRKP